MVVLWVVAGRFIGSAEGGSGGIWRVDEVDAALGFWKRKFLGDVRVRIMRGHYRENGQ